MDDTRTKILKVAEELIQNVGLNAMSYKHISDDIGISKASIHHHFPRKEDLVNALLEHCHVTYSDNYRSIVEGAGSAPEKLKAIAGVFENGLLKQQLCFVGTISSDLNTLQPNSTRILEATIQGTIDIYTILFEQGRAEASLSFAGTEKDAAYAFFSFLLGVQIAARAYGGAESFRRATESFISGWIR